MKGGIFLVEDDLDVLEYYCLLLVAGQMEVWGTARTGEEAVRRYIAACDPPDVLLLDHRLPGCTGLDAARQILEVDPRAVIVLVTADEAALKEAKAMGITRTKRKPVTNARLLGNLAGALRESMERRRRAI